MNVEFSRPVHPGEFLREEYLVPLAMSSGDLAKALHVPRTRIERIVKQETGITPDTALRLARFFETTPEFWMNFQVAYELRAESVNRRNELAAIETYAARKAAA